VLYYLYHVLLGFVNGVFERREYYGVNPMDNETVIRNVFLRKD